MDYHQFSLYLFQWCICFKFLNQEKQFFVYLILFLIQRIYGVDGIAHLVRHRSIDDCKELLFSLSALIENVHADIDDFKHIISPCVRLEFLPLNLYVSMIAIYFILVLLSIVVVNNAKDEHSFS